MTADDVRKRLASSRGTDSATCEHDDLYWYAAPADECGWVCADCGWSPGEEPGYSPEHDRSHIKTKVGSILHDLHDAGIIYVSNSSGGDGLTSHVAAWCKRNKTYDSVSIAARILANEAGGTHATFWRERGESILEGRDNRNRCHCGKLAHISVGSGNGGWNYYCSYACEPERSKGLPF